MAESRKTATKTPTRSAFFCPLSNSEIKLAPTTIIADANMNPNMANPDSKTAIIENCSKFNRDESYDWTKKHDNIATAKMMPAWAMDVLDISNLRAFFSDSISRFSREIF